MFGQWDQLTCGKSFGRGYLANHVGALSLLAMGTSIIIFRGGMRVVGTLSKVLDRYWLIVQIVSAVVTIGAFVGSFYFSYAIYFVLGLLVIYATLTTMALHRRSKYPLAGKSTRAPLTRVRYVRNESTVEVDTSARVYYFTFVREIVNEGDEPLVRFPWHFYINAFPDEPEKSRAYYATHTVVWEDLDAKAWDESGMLDIDLITDFNGVKEAMVSFAHKGVQRPVYAGERRIVTRTMKVGAEIWGRYLERAILDPTDRVSVVIIAPSSLRDFHVGGRQWSGVGQVLPLSNPPRRSLAAANQVWVWEDDDPKLGHTYQIQWSDLPAA